MKRTSLFALALLGAVAGRAAGDDENRPPAPPPENLSFLTDEYIYIPKFTFSFGLRSLTGSKTAFSGKGSISSTADSIGEARGANLTRVYHDGSVSPDARVDDQGNSVNGIDGKTNTWAFRDASQATADGNIALHSYTADLIDGGARTKNPKGNAFGVEMAVARDMGKIAARFDWNLAAGLSLNDLKSNFQSQETARVTTTTDTFSLGGAPAPTTAPYASPATTTQNVYDANGNQVYNADGTVQTQTVDTSVLLVSDPLNRSVATTTENASVTNHWKLKGAYFTFRAGPTILLPISQRFRVSFSAGAAVVYSGTTYSIRQDFQPATGDQITSTVSESENHVQPGYYADANLEFWLTETAGLFAGAVYQNNGDFKQTVKTDTANYATKVDLSRLSGLRAGMNIRF